MLRAVIRTTSKQLDFDNDDEDRSLSNSSPTLPKDSLSGLFLNKSSRQSAISSQGIFPKSLAFDDDTDAIINRPGQKYLYIDNFVPNYLIKGTIVTFPDSNKMKLAEAYCYYHDSEVVEIFKWIIKNNQKLIKEMQIFKLPLLQEQIKAYLNKTHHKRHWQVFFNFFKLYL